MLEESVRKDVSESKMTLDEEDRKRLESLGYVSETVIEENFQFDKGKDDPKDLIALHNLNANARRLLTENSCEEAKKICWKML